TELAKGAIQRACVSVEREGQRAVEQTERTTAIDSRRTPLRGFEPHPSPKHVAREVVEHQRLDVPAENCAILAWSGLRGSGPTSPGSRLMAVEGDLASASGRGRRQQGIDGPVVLDRRPRPDELDRVAPIREKSRKLADSDGADHDRGHELRSQCAREA